LQPLAVFPSIKFPTGSTASGAGTGTTDVGIVLISSRELGGVSLDLNAGMTHRIGKDNLAPHNSSVWAVSFDAGTLVSIDPGSVDQWVRV